MTTRMEAIGLAAGIASIIGLGFGVGSGVAFGQATQGLITGRVVDTQTGLGVAGAVVNSFSAATNAAASARTDSSGTYLLPLLPPGQYRIHVTAAAYQPQDLQDLTLPVAARVDIDFRLRPLSDVWESGRYHSLFFPESAAVVTFFGPDVDPTRLGSFEPPRTTAGTLEAGVSAVIDPAEVRDLPLAGRDVYSTLVTEAGVTSDLSTARGLGLSISGQRPTSSNFMLDGVENNNYLVTGPLMTVAPEAVQEYRVSTNNYSAEYGRTAAFVANAVTRSGGSKWHGLGYFDWKNEALNANGFQGNWQGISRRPDKEDQFGYQAGGPLPRRGLFVSSAFEQLRDRQLGNPTTVLLPTTNLLDFTAFSGVARALLTQYPAPQSVAAGKALTAAAILSPPVSLDRSLALERIDYSPGDSRNRLTGRVAIARLGRPDFIWSPYQDFDSALRQDSVSVAMSWVRQVRSNLTSEARAGWTSDTIGWDRAHPEIPTLVSGDGAVLPGSPAFYAYRNRGRNVEMLENVLWAQGRHIFKAGGGLLVRRMNGYLTAGRDGEYAFPNALYFALDAPSFLSVAVDRSRLSALRIPDYQRDWAQNEFFLFAQDTFRLYRHFTLNFGVRYESFGAPVNTGGVKDATVQLGQGTTIEQRIAGAQLMFPRGGNDPLYAADRNDFAGRFGFAWQPGGWSNTVIRGGYGTYYDRPFDNLWQNLRNNNLVLAGFGLPQAFGFNYLQPLGSVLTQQQGSSFTNDFPGLTMFQPGFRDPYVQSYFLGVQQRIRDAWTIEINATGALGRELITTDLLNRPYSVPISATNPGGVLNPALPLVSYRGNQGSSDYAALTAVAHYRGRSVHAQVSYTWGHSIDNQSDSLAGDFFDLNFTNITSGSSASAISSFTRQFASGGDRGSSDFDQRHNLVFLSLWSLPALAPSSKFGWLLRDWKFSQLGALRSGFPYTVYAPSPLVAGSAEIINNRASLTGAPTGGTGLAAGGVQWLNPAAFTAPAPGQVGYLGRNALVGPGLLNIDCSLSRSAALRWLGEAGRLTVRADAFNVLNHVNLNNPDNFISSSTFGVAQYGRSGVSSRFPALTPLNETARQIQLILRLEF